MSKAAQRGLVGGTTLVVVALLTLLTLGGSMRSGSGSALVREIVLSARDLAFNESNPTLTLRPGERVRFVVRNDDPGVLHSITLPGIDSRVRLVRPGEQVAFEVSVPEGGRFEYTCPQHLPKMRGRIEVAPIPEAR